MTEEKAFEALDKQIRLLELKRHSLDPNWDMHEPEMAKAISLQMWRKLRRKNPDYAAVIDQRIADVESGRTKAMVSRDYTLEPEEE
jgi:hypothetical protein